MKKFKKLKNILIIAGIISSFSFVNCCAADLLEGKNVNYVQDEVEIQDSGNMFNFVEMIHILNDQNVHAPISNGASFINYYDYNFEQNEENNVQDEENNNQNGDDLISNGVSFISHDDYNFEQNEENNVQDEENNNQNGDDLISNGVSFITYSDSGSE